MSREELLKKIKSVGEMEISEGDVWINDGIDGNGDDIQALKVGKNGNTFGVFLVNNDFVKLTELEDIELLEIYYLYLAWFLID